MDRRTGRKRTSIAAVVAVLAHLGVLWTLGWRSPHGPTLPVDDHPAINLELMPRPPPPATATAQAGPVSTNAIRQAPSGPRPAPAQTNQPTVDLPPTQQASGNGGDCEPEDIPLLTDAERAHCRNQIDALKGRELARTADARLARKLAALSTAPHVDSIPAEKRAYYDAVAAAYDRQTHGGPMEGKYPGVGCSIKFSGLTIVKTKPPPNSLSLGPCFVSPPQGFLTEESGVRPP